MDQVCKRRGRPLPDATSVKPIAFHLEEALAIETQFRPNLLVIQDDLKPWEVNLESRDAAIHVLRFLRFWFDLPHSIFFSAVTHLDLFLAKVKIQEKYLNCVTMACLCIAASREGINIDLKDMVVVSQTKFTERDLQRMVGIVKEKTKLEDKKITTPADFLEINMHILEYVISCWGDNKLLDILAKERLLTRLEVLMADKNCAFFSSSTIALVLLKIEIERMLSLAVTTKTLHIVGDMLRRMIAIIREIQFACKVKNADLANCTKHAAKVLKDYDNQKRNYCAQHLIWYFSSKTIYQSRKCRNYQNSLETIDERSI